MDFVAGEILYIDKPYGWTSFKLVKKVRNKLSRELHLKKIKVGHAGTLDPLASGVMVICTGRATKKIESFQYHTKEYEATLRLGATTPSFDLETEVDGTYPIDHITEEQVREVLQRFVGTIWQTPPAFSACKVEGKRAYEYAREGEAVELKPKELVIDEIELLAYAQHELRIRVVCSKGTYIRALARDIGQALGSGAHLTKLVRTRIGAVGLADCLCVDDLDAFLEKEAAAYLAEQAAIEAAEAAEKAAKEAQKAAQASAESPSAPAIEKASDNLSEAVESATENGAENSVVGQGA